VTTPTSCPWTVRGPQTPPPVRGCPQNPKTPPDLHKRDSVLLSFQNTQRQHFRAAFPQVRGCLLLSSLRERGVPPDTSPLTRQGTPTQDGPR
jgi:hypothetical protein